MAGRSFRDESKAAPSISVGRLQLDASFVSGCGLRPSACTLGRCGQPFVPKMREVTDQTGYCWEPRLLAKDAVSLNYFGHQKFGGLPVLDCWRWPVASTIPLSPLNKSTPM